MSSPKRTVYLERASYRRRRARDASRLLPLLFLLVFLAPGLWQAGGDGGIKLSNALIFIFVAWCIAIGLAALLSRYLTDPSDTDETASKTDGEP